MKPPTDVERLVKSSHRVRHLGEVFTPRQTVQEILDLLPDEMWVVHPAPTFLEPACGDGNFLVVVLERKLSQVAQAAESGSLPAGRGNEAVVFHGLEALSSIYGVDISPENIVGGSPEHPIGARDRLRTHFARWVEGRTGTPPPPGLLASVSWVTEANILVGNPLEAGKPGVDSVDDPLWLAAFDWDPRTSQVTVSRTSFRDVIGGERQASMAELSLFGHEEPTVMWSGAPADLHQAALPGEGLA